MARRMVTEFGMSEHLGPYAVEQARQPLFLDNGYQSPKRYSEATAQRVDGEAQALVERMYERARRTLEVHRDKLEALAQYLLQHEVIDQASLAILLGDLRPAKQPELAGS
jgi:cell division protease FtsH